MDAQPTSGAKGGFADASRLVQSWVDRGFYPGAGLVVGRSDGIVLEEYFGGHDGSTVEFIASAGKWLAAAAIAAVVDQGLAGRMAELATHRRFDGKQIVADLPAVANAREKR